MTKIKLLITTLILGSSAAAFAAPTATVYQTNGYRQPTATIVVNRPAPAPMPAPQWQRPAQWSTLAASTKVSGRDTIMVGGWKKFDTLKLQSLGGSTSLTKVQIKFADGSMQSVRLNQTLDRSNAQLSLDLNGNHRQIASITLVGSSNRRGSLEVLAI